MAEGKTSFKDIVEGFGGAIQVGFTLLFSSVLRNWYNRWGVSEAEFARTFPGDELVPHPKFGYTRAITIHAPPEKVWPWLLQMGHARGGLYSYDALENLVGCQLYSVDRILPQFQQLSPGDLVRLGPQGFPAFAVHEVQDSKALVMVGSDAQTGQPLYSQDPPPETYTYATWQFIIEPLDGGFARLFVRQRLDHSQGQRLTWRIVEPINFVMERKMLRGVKQRAEALVENS